MEQPDSSSGAPPNESGPSSAVELQRQQRRAKRFVHSFALAVIAGPFCLAALAFLLFWAASGSAWSLLGIPLIALAALISMALPMLVPAFFVLGAWALIRSYYRKPAATPAAVLASRSRATRPSAPLAAEVALLEELRGRLAVEARRRSILFVPVGLGIALLLFMLTIGRDGSSQGSPAIAFILFMIIGGGGAWIWAVGGPGARYRQAFKRSLIPRLLAAHGDLAHSLGARPDLGRAVSAGLLPVHDGVIADDGFTGTYRGHPITISEIAITRKTGKTEISLFQGLYVEITVSTPFNGTTILCDRDAPQPGHDLHRLQLEDPVFAEVYAAWSTDQIEGRAVLTPAVMERLLVMADGTSFLPPLFMISGDRMVFALPALIPGALFEPPGLETHVAAQQLASLEADFAHVFALVDAMVDMHLSVRAPDAALPPSPPARTPPR